MRRHSLKCSLCAVGSHLVYCRFAYDVKLADPLDVLTKRHGDGFSFKSRGYSSHLLCLCGHA